MLEENSIHKNMINLPNYYIATTLTHRKMIDNNLNNCIVFEDDVFFERI